MTSLCRMGSEKAHGCAQIRRISSAFVEMFRAKPKRRRWISQLHRTSNRWWNLGFICECWNQRAVKVVDAHTFTKQAEKVQINVVCLPETRWQLISGREKEWGSTYVSTYLTTYPPFYGSTAAFSVSWSFTQSVGLLGRGSARRKAAACTQYSTNAE
jgi:hypothetical protein